MTSEKKFLEVPRAIWHFLGGNKRKYVALNIVLFGVLFYDLVPPWIVGKMVDFFTRYAPGDSLRTFYALALALGLSHIIVSIVRLTSKVVLTRIAIAAKTSARVTGFERLMDFSLLWHAKENSGNKMQRVFTGSDAIPEWATMLQNALFPVAATFAGTLGFFLFRSPMFTVFLLCYMAAFFAIEAFFNRRLKALSGTVNQHRESASGKYVEGAGNILAIKALGAEKDVGAKLSASEEDFKEIQMRMANTGTNKWYCFQTLTGVAMGVFMLLTGRAYLAHAISVGDILVFFTYFWKLREAANNATDLSTRVIQLRADILRMMPIFVEETGPRSGTAPFPAEWENIFLENASFRYPGGREAIKDLTLLIRKGERIGVAGASGSGKSTLIKVLLGLYTLGSGTFRIGDKDYYSLAHDAVMKNIAVVLQETELFNLSLRENITLGREVPPELLQRAVTVARLETVIARLQGGLDALVGERGYALSGGERQRIGIARAVCKDAPIVLLDEATSALDNKTEQEVMDQLMGPAGEGKTFVIVAHRLSTLKGTDRVLVFDKGVAREEAYENVH